MKRKEQIELEENLLEQRVKLRERQNKKIQDLKNNHLKKKQAKKEKDEQELKKYNQEKERYDKLTVEEKKNPINQLPPLQPLIPNIFLIDIDTTNYYKLEEEFKKERASLRYQHAKLVEFRDELEKLNFLENDYDSPVSKKRIVDMNAKSK